MLLALIGTVKGREVAEISGCIARQLRRPLALNASWERGSAEGGEVSIAYAVCVRL
jgi:hypothetical protein